MFPTQIMNYYALLPLASFVLNVFLWTFVFALHSRSLAKRVYLLFIVLCALWAFADFVAWSHESPTVQYWLLRLESSAWISLTYVYLYFSFLLVEKKLNLFFKLLGGAIAGFLVLSLATDWVVEGIVLRNWGPVVIPGKAYGYTVFVSVLVPGIYAMIITALYAQRAEGLVKKQLRFFLAGIVGTWVLVLFVNIVLVTIMEIESLPSLGSTLVSLQAIVVFVASTRYRFLNVGIEEVAVDIFSRASDGVIILTESGKICEINQAALGFLNQTKESAVGSMAESVICEPYRFSENQDNLEVCFSASNDIPMLGLLSQCDFQQGGSSAGKLVTIKNITDLKVAEKAKLEAAMLAQQVRRNQESKMIALGELASGLVHNFNNMLSGILGYNSVLRSQVGGGSARVDKMLDGIGHTVENAVSMGKELMAFSRTGIPNETTFNIHQCIQGAVNLLTHTLAGDISVQLQLNAKKYWIRGDSANMENAVLNLGINARDALPNGGTIHVRTENMVVKKGEEVLNSGADGPIVGPGQYIQIAVEDNGTGISSDVMERIFEPFFTTKKSDSGTGLGLSSTYGIVKNHRGHILVKSDGKTGTAFFIQLPVVPEE